MSSPRVIDGDWFDGVIPENVTIGDGAYIETAFSFRRFRSCHDNGLGLGRGSAVYQQTEFDVGPDGRISIGEFTLMNSVRLICDGQITIGSHCLLSWNVVIMDSRRVAIAPASRRKILEQAIANQFEWPASPVAADPVTIGGNVWIGFDSIILPGVSIGEGSVIGTRSVVYDSIPEYSVAVGNPARVVRSLEPIQNENVTE